MAMYRVVNFSSFDLSLQDRLSKIPFSFEAEVMRHYQRYDMSHWKEFLGEWLPVAEWVAWMASEEDGHVMAVLLGVKRSWCASQGPEAYVRVLCSCEHQGGRLLDAFMRDREEARDTCRISLHSEPGVVGFYKKKGFALMTTSWESDIGVRYPLMLRPLGHSLGWVDVVGGEMMLGEGEWFYFGWAYYVGKHFALVMMFMVAVAAILLKGRYV